MTEGARGAGAPLWSVYNREGRPTGGDSSAEFGDARLDSLRPRPGRAGSPGRRPRRPPARAAAAGRSVGGRARGPAGAVRLPAAVGGADGRRSRRRRRGRATARPGPAADAGAGGAGRRRDRPGQNNAAVRTVGVAAAVAARPSRSLRGSAARNSRPQGPQKDELPGRHPARPAALPQPHGGGRRATGGAVRSTLRPAARPRRRGRRPLPRAERRGDAGRTVRPAQSGRPRRRRGSGGASGGGGGGLAAGDAVLRAGGGGGRRRRRAASWPARPPLWRRDAAPSTPDGAGPYRRWPTWSSPR